MFGIESRKERNARLGIDVNLWEDIKVELIMFASWVYNTMFPTKMLLISMFNEMIKHFGSPEKALKYMRGWKRFFISPEHKPTENIDRANSIEGDVNAKLLIENAELKTKLEAKEIELTNLKEDALNTDKAREKWLQLARKQAMEIKLLRRVLYLAKAERAKEAKYLWHVYFRTPYLRYCAENGDSRTRKNPFKHIANKSHNDWVAFWGNIEEKYRKLAEKLK